MVELSTLIIAASLCLKGIPFQCLVIIVLAIYLLKKILLQSGYGGAIYTYNGSHIMFKGYNDGGAIYSEYYSYITFEGNSSPVFSNNIASRDAGYGGAIYTYNGSVIMFKANLRQIPLFKGNSSSVFSNNSANYGAVLTLLVGSNNIL